MENSGLFYSLSYNFDLGLKKANSEMSLCIYVYDKSHVISYYCKYISKKSMG